VPRTSKRRSSSPRVPEENLQKEEIEVCRENKKQIKWGKKTVRCLVKTGGGISA